MNRLLQKALMGGNPAMMPQTSVTKRPQSPLNFGMSRPRLRGQGYSDALIALGAGISAGDFSAGAQQAGAAIDTSRKRNKTMEWIKKHHPEYAELGGVVSPEALLGVVSRTAKTPDFIQRYNLARSQGYEGSIFEYEKALKSAGATKNVANFGDNQIKLPDPEKGYNYVRNPDGTLKFNDDGLPIVKPTPGGSVDRKDQAREKTAAYEKFKSTVVLDNLRLAKERVIRNPKLSTGIVGTSTSGIGWTPGNEVARYLGTVEAHIGLDALNNMRQQSPTGGALGNVSNFEVQTLQAIMGSLKQDQRPEVLRYQMDRLHNYYLGVIHGHTPEEAGVDMTQEEWDKTIGRVKITEPGVPDSIFDLESGDDIRELPEGWTQEEWDVLSDEEKRLIRP